MRRAISQVGAESLLTLANDCEGSLVHYEAETEGCVSPLSSSKRPGSPLAGPTPKMSLCDELSMLSRPELLGLSMDLEQELSPLLPPTDAPCPPSLSLSDELTEDTLSDTSDELKAEARARVGGQAEARAQAEAEAQAEASTYRCWQQWQCSLSKSLIGAPAFTRALLLPAVKAADMERTLKILARLSPRQIEALHPPSRRLVGELQQRMIERLMPPRYLAPTVPTSEEG